MIKAVRHKANIDGEYGQNPIEWLNFLSKEEIDEFGKMEGHNDCDVILKPGAHESYLLSQISFVVDCVRRQLPCAVNLRTTFVIRGV